MISLNETPVRTARNFNINNIKLENFNVPKNVLGFENVEIKNKSSDVEIDDKVQDADLTYGLGEFLECQVRKNSNKNLHIVVCGKTEKQVNVEFKFDAENTTLIDNIDIVARENSRATVVIKYESEKEAEGYHNGIVRVRLEKNAKVNVIIVNLMNTKSQNFMSIENVLEENAKLNYTVVDFGGKSSITNYYSNLARRVF